MNQVLKILLLLLTIGLPFIEIDLLYLLYAFYLLHVIRTKRVHAEKKSLWAAVLLLGNIIAMPIYWYLYIWREPPVPTPPNTPALPA